MNLKSCPVDYSQAFPQALLDNRVYIRIPEGWFVCLGFLHQHENPKHHYMKLKRNLYGCKQAARDWFEHLTKGLIEQGFQ